MSAGAPLSVTVAVDFGGGGPRGGGGGVREGRGDDVSADGVEVSPKAPGQGEAVESRHGPDDVGDAVPADRPPCRAARLLALAEFVERRIEAGDLRDLADAAERFGVTRARMTQVANLALLAPEIQEGLLLGRRSESERRLRSVLGEAAWERQRARLAGH